MLFIIIECMLIGVIAALTGIFYNYTLSTGQIFQKLGVYLNDWAKFDIGFKNWLANILGACIYCNTTWIAIVLIIIYWVSWNSTPNISCIIIGTLATLSTQHIVIRIFNRIR